VTKPHEEARTVECEACAGTGRYGFRDDDECPVCHGLGSVEVPMTKVHEETWEPVTAHLDGDLVESVAKAGTNTIVALICRRDTDTRSAAALVAQAPAMARLLLEMWEESLERNGPYCPAHVGALLRAAGVLP